MKYKLSNYKGKHYVIQDELWEMDYGIDEIEDKELTDEFLKSHIEACNYYGIPAYIGKNKKLHKKIERLTKLKI